MTSSSPARIAHNGEPPFRIDSSDPGPGLSQNPLHESRVFRPVLLVLCAMVLFGARLPAQDPIDRATRRGVAWLLRAQEVDGSWKGPHIHSYPSGMTALAIYTLVKCGLPRDHRAIRKASAFMLSRECSRTYGIGTNLMAIQVLGKETAPKRARRLASILIDGFRSGRWGYLRPGNDPADLSNTQYALLGLKAAAAMGIKVPVELWKEAAQGLMDTQQSYGGWSYRAGEGRVTSSMTAAGVCGLIICRRKLEHVKHTRSLRRRIDVHIQRGLEWFRRNWSVDKNLVFPVPKDGGWPRRWYYHYLYALERVGSLSGADRIGGHDWHAEGARAILERQGGNGSWGTIYGENDVNTALALLFLRRGSRVTGAPPPPAAVVLDREKAPFLIAARAGPPLLAWVRTLGAPIHKRLETGERIQAVRWFIEDAQVARIAAPRGPEARRADFVLKHAIDKNGRHTIRAVMDFVAHDGTPAGSETSNRVQLTIDSIMEEADREAIRDAGRNLVLKVGADAEASTSFEGRDPGNVADGTYTTHWLCARGDRNPWIRIRLRRSVKARAIKFTGAHPYADNDTNFGRPKDVEVIINGRRRFKRHLPDTVRRKHVITFDRMKVSRVTIRIKSLYPGTRAGEEQLVGIKEIEVMAAP